jgi:transposase-like protein
MLRRLLPPNNESVAKVSREEGIPQQTLTRWKNEAKANGGVAKEAAKLNRDLKDSKKEVKKLEKELQRKEKALAEAAALLVLSKKANAIWGDPEEEK